MPRLHPEALALMGALTLGGCIQGEGLPWGVAELSASAAFAPEASRLDDDGRLLTVHYAIDVEAVSLATESVGLNQLAGGTSVSFDPANPPDGYSLCHNGHCHHESGALVAYEDIGAELAAGGSGGASLTILTEDAGPVLLGETEVDIPLEACEPCYLVRGEVSGAQARFGGIHISGRAFDRDGLSSHELPDGGVAFVIDIPVDVTVNTPLSEPVERGEPLGVAVHLSLSPSDTLLDDVLFASFVDPEDPDAALDLSAQPEVIAAIEAQLGALVPLVERFDPNL